MADNPAAGIGGTHSAVGKRGGSRARARPKGPPGAGRRAPANLPAAGASRLPRRAHQAIGGSPTPKPSAAQRLTCPSRAAYLGRSLSGQETPNNLCGAETFQVCDRPRLKETADPKCHSFNLPPSLFSISTSHPLPTVPFDQCRPAHRDIISSLPAVTNSFHFPPYCVKVYDTCRYPVPLLPAVPRPFHLLTILCSSVVLVCDYPSLFQTLASRDHNPQRFPRFRVSVNDCPSVFQNPRFPRSRPPPIPRVRVSVTDCPSLFQNPRFPRFTPPPHRIPR